MVQNPGDWGYYNLEIVKQTSPILFHFIYSIEYYDSLIKFPSDGSDLTTDQQEQQ